MKNGKVIHISKLVDFYDFLIKMSYHSPRVPCSLDHPAISFNSIGCPCIDNSPAGHKKNRPIAEPVSKPLGYFEKLPFQATVMSFAR